MNIVSKFQVLSFYGLGVKVSVCGRLCFEDIFTKHDLINPLISNKAVCRTAPATLGLLVSDIHLVPVWSMDDGDRKRNLLVI